MVWTVLISMHTLADSPTYLGSTPNSRVKFRTGPLEPVSWIRDLAGAF
jgi:hypothetical protein